MERIMVIGVSAGVGKSTLTRNLGKKLNIPVYYLDCHYWNPGWKEASEDQFRERQKKIVANEKWVIDGNYSSTMNERLPYADTIIYIELPRWFAIYQVLKRWLTHLGKEREDRAEGCTEQMEWGFLHFIWTTYKGRKKKFRKMLKDLKSEKRVIILNSRKEIDKFLHEL
ncbi:topology modulation protein [Lottiidibacillus patelloidae]|uniref:Topology modulation protein n=1 Tax=Lottiidibacillus patelloidae TaxID=2670334 RepID=A0A263BXE2_9BACI|nr:topology modulation protein [Lottiidibacillus patelloidae]OZM57977.1 topology modulation protein [Lottiidibacillus patelloidae]